LAGQWRLAEIGRISKLLKQPVIVYPMPLSDITDITKCTDYETMQAYNIHKHAHKNTISIGAPYSWLQKGIASKFDALSRILVEHGININDVGDLVITGINSVKYVSAMDIQKITKSIKGKMYQIDDSNFNQNPYTFTFTHYTKKSHADDRSIEIGLAVATDLFKPEQKFDNNEFVVHVDHRWTKTHRIDGFADIKNQLQLISSLIKKNLKWKTLKIIYHTEIVNDIDKIGTYDPKPVPITDLAKIYGNCHLSFLSHAETLGQYPLEMLSSGATILMHKKMIPKETRNCYPYYTFDKFDHENYLNTMTQSTIEKNRQSVLKFDYSYWVENMLKHLQEKK
jgi:hypothetical protein